MPEKLTPKQIRGLNELSQEQMGDKLGLSREHYSRIESDSAMLRKSKIELAINLANIANLRLDDINFFY